jgi:DNA recombination protein RmuC
VALLYVIAGLSGLAAILALLSLLQGRQQTPLGNVLTKDDLSETVRGEADRIRADAADQSRGVRQEVRENLQGFQSATLNAFGELGKQFGEQVKNFGNKLDGGLRAMDEGHKAITQVLERKFAEQANVSSDGARTSRAEIAQSFQGLAAGVKDAVGQLGSQQKERLEAVTGAVAALTESHDKAQSALRSAVEGRLDAIRTENAAKLEEMRKAVDEKLQSTLERRLGESFKMVSDQLERVYQGLGEMQSLAAGVGDLNKILSNVKVRGIWGELQLSNLLEQVLTPDQYYRDKQIKADSRERVEFAIRLPGRDGNEVLLAIDAKFPREDFERLVQASDRGDKEGADSASAALEARVRGCAKTISEKYIDPPRTTDMAILFLPIESLYAEVLRRPGLFQELQSDYHVTLAGPTTLSAILNALHMGFQSLAIEKRSSEVWQILGAIRSEFNKYGEIVERLRRQLNSAVGTIDTLGTRARTMNRKLRDVEVLPDAAAQKLLGLEQVQIAAEPGTEHYGDEVSGPDRRPEVPHPDSVSESDTEAEANENSEDPWWKQGA